jgi:hypothetical protein
MQAASYKRHYPVDVNDCSMVTREEAHEETCPTGEEAQYAAQQP